MISHTQGWLHCDIPGTDASGVVKSLMDMMHQEFIKEEMPNRVRITTSCCQINCGGQGDISINVQYTKPPKINHDLVAESLRTPGRRRALPGGGHPPGAGRRQAVAGSRRAEVRVLRRLLSALSADADQWRGFDQDRDLGWRQALQRALQADLPQAGGRQSAEQSAALAGSRRGRERILYAYKDNARDWERIGEWIDRIGWPRFFELTGFAFTKHHLDTWVGARKTMNMSAHVHF